MHSENIIAPLYSQNFNILRDGDILRTFINNQRTPKSKIAEDLGMSRRNLYQLFQSYNITPENKERFERYFHKTIFPNGSADKVTAQTPDFKTENEIVQTASIKVLFQEIAKLKAQLYHMRAEDCLIELYQNTSLLAADIKKDIIKDDV
jgi:hypothetical protein